MWQREGRVLEARRCVKGRDGRQGEGRSTRAIREEGM